MEKPHKMEYARDTYERFLQFRAVTIQAIAKAWSDEEYAALLKADPRAAFEQIGYNCPFNIDIESNPDNAEWRLDLVADWKVDTLNTLTMVLPPKPKNRKDELVALATYNTTHLTFLGS